MTGHDPCRVTPFGDPRITACYRLPEAFRRSPRPSSPPGAEASTVRPFYLTTPLWAFVLARLWRAFLRHLLRLQKLLPSRPEQHHAARTSVVKDRSAVDPSGLEPLTSCVQSRRSPT